ncbi:MAG: hypothetical protein NTX61_13765 [Bacteroidetes bacterium]|nr:hypothetical protein [Bacteroidota bacterium]
MAQKKLPGSKTTKKSAKTEIAEKPVFKVNYYLGIFLAAIALSLYVNGINHGYLLDDSAAVTDNNYVQQGIQGIPKLLTTDFWHFSSVRLGYYRPLPLITYAIEFQFFGLSPHVSHFNNVLFFAIAVFFLFLLLSRLFSGYNALFPFIITILFTAHPIHTEIVDNIKGRDELLSFLNTIAMLYFALRYAESKKSGFLVIGVLLFYMALMSKESAMSGILLIPLVLWYSGEKSLIGLAKKTLPFLLAIILFIIQKHLLFETKHPVIPIDPVNYPYTAELVKYSSAFMLFLFFLRILIFPHPLRYDYSYNLIPAVGWDSLLALLGFFVFIGILVYTIIEVRKKSRVGFALGFFYITLIPPLAFIMTRGGIFAERLLFFPSLGFCFLIALLLEKITGSSFSRPLKARLESYKGYLFIAPLILVVFALYSFKTIDRNKAWKDRLSLYGTDIKTGKNSAQNQLHYGSYWLRMAQVEKDSVKRAQDINNGLAALHQAVTILPGFGDALYWIGFAYEVKAFAHPDIKTIDSAMFYYNYSIERAPKMFMSYYHLANLYEWIGRFDVSSYYYNRAHDISPEYLPVLKKVQEMKEKRGLDVRVNPLTGRNF